MNEDTGFSVADHANGAMFFRTHYQRDVTKHTGSGRVTVRTFRFGTTMARLAIAIPACGNASTSTDEGKLNHAGGGGVVDYPVVALEEARVRADDIITVVGLESDVGLEDRLVQLLRATMSDRAANALAQETDHLYFLLHDPTRDQEHKPVDVAALHRSLTLAMSRPADDPCWRDYQVVVAAIASRWAEASTEFGVHPIRNLRRRLTHTRPDEGELEASWQKSIMAAKRHFIATWREG